MWDVGLEPALTLEMLIRMYDFNLDIATNKKNEYVVFKKCYEDIDRVPMLNWIENVFTRSSVKNDNESKESREKGNELYKKKEFHRALEAYTESVARATRDGNELTLAYANRSAVLYSMGEYRNSLNDIENCLKTNYPDKLKHKVLLRRANCYVRLNRREDVIQTVLMVRNWMNDGNRIDQDRSKIETVLREVVEIEKRIETPTNATKIDEETNGNVRYVGRLPELRDGPNKKFLHASAGIDLLYDVEKGRHVVANRKINAGDVLFVEKPFAFVPTAPETIEDVHRPPRCHNCHEQARSSVSCEYCMTLYCCVECLEVAWARYHRWECLGCCVDVWTKIGIGYMALRITLLGAGGGFETASMNPEDDVEKYGDTQNNYKYVSKLTTNIDKVDPQIKSSSVLTAVLLTLYLKTKTNFFEHLRTVPNIPSHDDEELTFLVGGTLVRHLLQVNANASVIEDVSTEFVEKFDSPEQMIEDGYYVRAAGIYPSVSMMNHSCDTNIAYHFLDSHIIVKARRVIVEGEEVTNCYGYDYRKYDTDERKFNLEKQYCFTCKCEACSHPTRPELFRNGLQCQACNGCSLECERYFKCLECGRRFSPDNHFVYILKAEQLHKKYEETGNVDYLEKCLSIRSKAFHKHNRNVLSINLVLQEHYAKSGQFMKWWNLAKEGLETDRVFLGSDYLQYAVYIRRTVYIVLRYLSTLSTTGVNVVTRKELTDMLNNLSTMLDEMKKLFLLFYPDDLLSFDKLDASYDRVVEKARIVAGRNLLKYDREETSTHQYVNYLNSVI